MSRSRSRPPARSSSVAGRPARDADEGPAAVDAAEAEATPPLLARLEAAADIGDLDPRQLAEALGVSGAGLRALLAEPARLDPAQATLVGRALGVDAAVMRQLRRAPATRDDATDGETARPGTPEPPDHGRTPAGADAAGATPAVGTLDTLALPRPAAPPRSALEALERVLGAVAADDDVGAALRRGTLDVVERAAREAGRPLPPGVHELRARMARGALPWSAGSAEPPPAPAPRRPGRPAEADPLLAPLAALVRTLQREGAGWGDLFAPLHDDALAALLPRHTLALRPVPAPPSSRAVLVPPLYGRHLLVLSDAASADQRRMAVRRALAHVVGAHLDEASPLAEPAPPALAALADGAALADLVPFWQLADLRRGGKLGWTALETWAADAARSLAPDWSHARALDAGRRRVALWRAEGL